MLTLSADLSTAYQTAVERLYALGHELANTPSERFNLAYMRAILRELRNPERSFASVLVGGTNGKGSTAATLASILEAAGHRTGLYTSPHLHRVNERMRVNGGEIADRQFAGLYQRVEAVSRQLVETGELLWHPSFFETVTAIAFGYFAAEHIEIAVVEVGMGGRLDATNVVDPILSVITDIALDHQKFLGNTITEIAREKAGIIRPGGVVVTLPQHPEANDVIGNTVAELGARAVSAVPYVPPVAPGTQQVPGIAPNGTHTYYPLRIFGKEIVVDSPLVGRHQLRNVALAIAAAEELNRLGFRVTAGDIERGIRESRWPGRFQRIAATAELPEIVLDVAHNPAGAWALRSALSEHVGDRPLILVFGVMRDKAINEIAEILFPVADQVIVTQADNPRSASPDEIREAAKRTGVEVEACTTVAEALARARELTPAGGVVVVTGSIYVVGEALTAFTSAADSIRSRELLFREA